MLWKPINMCYHLTVNKNREKEDNHNGSGDAKAIRRLKGPEKDTNGGYLRRITQRNTPKTYQRHCYRPCPEDAANSEESSVYLNL